MDALEIRGPLAGRERDAALVFLQKQRYGGAVADDADVFAACHQGEVVGVVRLTAENGVTMLRGMRVRDDLWGRRIGRRLLVHVAGVLDARREDCYSVPYRRLIGFYSAVGFEVAAAEHVPSWLAEREQQYRARGLDVVVMVRTGRRTTHAGGEDKG